MASCIRWRLTGRIQAIDAAFRDRGVKESPNLAVLRATLMPAVLVETAFIDNMEDAPGCSPSIRMSSTGPSPAGWRIMRCDY